MDLLSIVWHSEITNKKAKDKEISILIQILEGTEMVILQNDNTNGFISIIKKYITMID